MIKSNEGSLDRIVRAIVGALLIALALSLTGWIQIMLLILAVVILITSAIGFCGLYQVCHINTLDKAPSDETPKQDFDLTKEVETIKPVAEVTTNPEPDLSPEAEMTTKDTDTQLPAQEKTVTNQDDPEEKI